MLIWKSVVYELSGFLSGFCVNADSAGRGTCQGWPEATAERLGLDGEKPCGHFPGSEGQLGRPVWHYRCDQTCPGVGAGGLAETRWSRQSAGGLVQLARGLCGRRWRV